MVMIETKADLKTAVLQHLSIGKKHAIPGKLLATRLGENNTRQIRLAIQELIKDGLPIIGSPKQPYGYYIAKTAEECQENLEALMSYLKMIALHHKYLLRASRKLITPEQLRMRLK